MKKFGGTRFTKAATGSPNVSNRVIGQNLRKQKLTEGSGTNPSKMGGGGSLMDTRSSSSGYAQDSAPYKHNIGVGGPVFDELKLKVKDA